MQPNPGQAQVLSNEIEDFSQGGGLYPGGTGIIDEFSYRLWDYNGTKPPNSFCAAYLKFRPIDGSNDGKPVEQYYNIGVASDYLPDNTGGNVISLRGKNFMDSTNWGHFLKTLRTGCGLEKGKLSTPTGIRVMERGVMTLVRVDQPHREGMDELPKTKEQEEKEKKFGKPKTLIPTRAVFIWDPNYARATQNVPPPPQPGQHQAPALPANPAATQMSQPVNGAPVQQPPPMPQGQGGGDYTLAGVIRSLLTRHNGSLSVTELPKQILEELGTNVTRESRVAILKESRDVNALAAIAQANNWTLAGDDLIG